MSTKKLIAILCPYFGKMDRCHMVLWFKCCKYNPEIDFILLSDDKEIEQLKRPENVRFVYMAWDTCKERIQKHYSFRVPLQYKYKICDLKPAYGELFADYVEGYGFWGHMDVSDTIFGNLRKFITDDLLRDYDKIHMYGHMTLYRNTHEVNARYRIPLLSGKSYRDVFMVEETMSFDEMYNEISINQIYKENNYNKIDEIEDLVADILPKYYGFWLFQDKGIKTPRVFEWNNGKLFEIILEGEIVRYREIGYVHYQKRRITNCLTEAENHYYMIPNRIISANAVLITPQWLNEVSVDKKYWDPVIGRVNRIINYSKNPKVFIRKLMSKTKRKFYTFIGK